MYKFEEIKEIKYDDIHGWKNAFIKIDKRRRETESGCVDANAFVSIYGER